MTKIINPTCEYHKNPLGIDVVLPRFSWQLQTDRRGAKQTAYRILAASEETLLSEGKADLWDSGRLESGESIHVVYAGKKLSSRQRVYWKVTVWDEMGAANEGETSWFEIGLLKRSEWKAKWIGAALSGGSRSTIPVPFLRKTFNLPKGVTSARLYVTALGVYECSINGQTIGDDVFTPGWTDYNKRIQYQVYDVTNLLHEGENALGAILGDGWAAGFVGLGNRQLYTDKPKFLAQLEITLKDGNTTTITSDRTWKHQFGPILESDMFMGEAYDARLELTHWNTPNYNDKSWLKVEQAEAPKAALVATNGPTVKRIEEIKPITDPVDKSDFIRRKAIFDMGQNMVGWVKLKGTAPAGTSVVLRFAEVLNPDGSLYTTNLRDARATDVYTFKGEGEEIWKPTFTFHGFRYVELMGYPGEVSRDTITGIVLHSEMEQTGSFECSDPTINQLQSNILWGQKGNFVDVPTDCPQRDERLGWTGDIQVFVRTAAFNMDVAGFMTKWANDVTDSQSEAGAVPAVVPGVINLTDGGPAWADAAVICPWTIYLCYGDKSILENNYGTMTKFMDFLVNESPDFIRCAPGYKGWMGFGDWLSINAETPRDLIGTAFLAYDANLMSQIASVLGKRNDASKYRKLFNDVKKAFQNRYLKGGTVTAEQISEARKLAEQEHGISRGNLERIDYGPVKSEVFNTELFTPSQTAYVLALHFDVLPEKLRSLASEELVADIKHRDLHLSTGFVGAPYLPHVLSNNGQLETAYTLLNQKTWPSWLYSVTKGATTIWERWDGWTEERGFQNPEMNSFNHYAYGSIGAWLYQTVAGIEIDPANPGYKHSILRPQYGGGLTHVSAKLKTHYGELMSQWNLQNGKFEWTVVVPANTSATVHLPAKEGSRIMMDGKSISHTFQTLEAGQYQFIVEGVNH
jgi:alpha-L-rhamnosidase